MEYFYKVPVIFHNKLQHEPHLTSTCHITVTTTYQAEEYCANVPSSLIAEGH